MGCVLVKALGGGEGASEAGAQEARNVAGLSLEEQRLRATRECRQLDTPAEARFQTILNLLQTVFKVPISVVGLIDADKLLLVSRAGVDATCGRRPHSFCDASLRLGRPTMMVVEDTLADARFQHNEFVEGPPHVRFYCGAPLVSSEGCIMGSLAVMDLVPRQFPAEMLNMVTCFAELVVRELERDRALVLAARQEQEHWRLVRSLSVFREAIALADLTHPHRCRIQFANEAWIKLTGLPAESCLQAPLWELVQLVGSQQEQHESLARMHDAVAQRKPFTLRAQLAGGRAPSANGGGGMGQLSLSTPPLRLLFRPATRDHLGHSGSIPLVGIPSFVGMVEGTAAEPPTYYFATVVEEAPEAPRTPRAGATATLKLLTRDSSDHVLISAVDSSSCELSPRSDQPTPLRSGSSVPSCFGLEVPPGLSGLVLGPLLGKGSFGRVYRGRYRGATVAVKVLECWTDAQQLPGTEDSVASGSSGGLACRSPQLPLKGPWLEAALSRELLHPNLVMTYQVASSLAEPSELDLMQREGGDDGLQDLTDTSHAPRKQLVHMWIVQQFCNRGTLYDAIDRGWLRMRRDLDSPLNMVALLQTAKEIASALSCLHSHGIVHGDLTGNNVMLTSSTKDARRFMAQVGDFGLARSLAGEDCIDTATVGTVTHMPPEVLVDGKQTKAMDVYSFGVLLFELYSQQRAWIHLRPAQVVYSVTTLGHKLHLPEGTPPQYKALAESCMSTDRHQRPSFESILETLDSMLAKTAPAAC